MCPIDFAREMRLLGWHSRRKKKGVWIFGKRFSNRVGVSHVVLLDAMRNLQLSAHDLAIYVTRSAGIGVGADPRPLLT